MITDNSLTDQRFKALRDQGFTGSTNDMLLQWLQANGASSGSRTDAWIEMLAAQGAPAGHRNDMWYALLGSLGYTGSLNDREYAFWKAGGDLGGGGPPPSDWIFYDPLDDSSYTENGDAFTISVPAGTVHDIWADVNDGARLRLPIADTDFVFTSDIDNAFVAGQKIATSGLLVEFPGTTTWLRLDYYITSTDQLRVFCASSVDNDTNIKLNLVVGYVPGARLRWTRSGDTFTGAYSLNGTTWIEAGVITLARAPEYVSLWAGNAGDAPAHTAQFSDVLYEEVAAPAFTHTMTSVEISGGPNWGYQASGAWGALSPRLPTDGATQVDFFRSATGAGQAFMRMTAAQDAGSTMLVETESGITVEGPRGGTATDFAFNSAALASFIQGGFTDERMNITFRPAAGSAMLMNAVDLGGDELGYSDPITTTFNDSIAVEKVSTSPQQEGRLDVILTGPELDKEAMSKVRIFEPDGTIWDFVIADATFIPGQNFWRWQETNFMFTEGENYTIVFVE